MKIYQRVSGLARYIRIYFVWGNGGDGDASRASFGAKAASRDARDAKTAPQDDVNVKDQATHGK
jgi:hypothetical protein